LTEPLGVFARLMRPVDFGAADRRFADLLFLLLVPENGSLLPALSCVARRLRDDTVVNRLRVEVRREVAHLVLTTDSWRGDQQAS
jgi:PTS system nitrogen regulatory IIA component